MWIYIFLFFYFRCVNHFYHNFLFICVWFYITFPIILIFTWCCKYFTHLFHWIYHNIFIPTTKMLYSCLRPSQLFVCLSEQCYFFISHICDFRNWCTSVSWKVIFQVSFIIFCIVLHISPMYYLFFSTIIEMFFLWKHLVLFSSTLFPSYLSLSLYCRSTSPPYRGKCPYFCKRCPTTQSHFELL